MSQHRCDTGPWCRRTVLDNGVRVLTERIERVGSASVGVWVVGGAREEPPGQEGITHFLEHMLFKGTDRLTAEDIARAADHLGGNVNGYTDRETLYLLARTVGERAGDALELLLEMLLESRCAESEVAREKEVVCQEIHQVEDTPEEWVHDFLLCKTWGDHPLGRSPLGEPDTIAGLDPETVRARRDHLCCGSRLVVSAAGRVDHDAIVGLAERRLGRLPRGEGPPPVPAPTFRAVREFVHRPTEQVHLCLATPGCGRREEQRHAFSVFDTILGGGAGSRLFQEVREKRGLAYHIASYLEAYEGAGLLTVEAGTGPETFSQVMELVEEEVARLRREGPTDEELDRAKTQLKVSLALAMESTSFRMQHLAMSEIVWGRVWSFREIAERVDAVTAEDVHRLAESSFTEGKTALVAAGPLPEGRG